MSLNNLPKITKISKKRLGQGHGSGKGKTAGRGTKGQKARGKIPQRIKMAGISFVKRLPLFRGKGKNKSIQTRKLVVNFKDLGELKANTVINIEFLISQKLIKKDEVKMFGVKLLGDGKISVPLTIEVDISNSARKKVEKAGGKIQASQSS